jgi:hypothetical protein
MTLWFETFEDAVQCVRDYEEMTHSRFVTIKIVMNRKRQRDRSVKLVIVL